MSIPIALQLYSVRNDCEKDLFDVLKQVAEMGYAGVEFAGYYGHQPGDIKMILNDLGLKTEGTHTPLSAFDDDKFDETVELHKILGTTFAIVPWIPEEKRNTPDACKATAERLTSIVHRLEAVGLRTGFHCHDGDMRPLAGGKTAWDIIAANTPSSFIMQYDTANGSAGGADPVQPILDWPGRSASVHLKGYNHGFGALVGEEGIPWDAVFMACETVGGTQWYVVEHEDESRLPPLEAVKKCLENLRALGK